MNHLKLKKRNLKTDPALILAAFGTTSDSNIVFENIQKAVVSRYPDLHCLMAYTSEIVREKTGLPGILECLATLEKKGYRKVILSPLHIFPATEYRSLCSLCESFSEMRIVVSETLAHRWPYIERIFDFLSKDFVPKSEGFNLVIGHGSPLAAEPANTIYLGIESYCKQMFDNVYFSTIDGIPSMSMMLKQIEKLQSSGQKVRLLPLMMTAGKHVKDDLLEGEESLTKELENSGFAVNTLSLELDGRTFAKCLGFYDEIIPMFFERIDRSLKLLEIY